MAQLWAALKSIGIIADLLRDILAWFRELRRKQALDQADALHDANQAAIDAAFSPGNAGALPPSGLPHPTPAGSGAAPAQPSGVSRSPGSVP